MSEALVKASDFGIVKARSVEALQMAVEALGGRQLTAADLDKIRIPTGGGAFFQVPSITGESDAVKQIDGIIMLVTSPRAYWKNKYSGAGQPPDCHSVDSITGEFLDEKGETVSRLCENCAFARWGSALDEKGQPAPGQACKAMKFVFLHRPEDAVLPVILVLPPTSVRPLEQYLLRLASRAVPPYGVITRFSLVPAQSKAGQKYSKIELKAVGRVDTDLLETLKKTSADYRTTFTSVTIEADDYQVASEPAQE